MKFEKHGDRTVVPAWEFRKRQKELDPTLDWHPDEISLDDQVEDLFESYQSYSAQLEELVLQQNMAPGTLLDKIAYEIEELQDEASGIRQDFNGELPLRRRLNEIKMKLKALRAVHKIMEPKRKELVRRIRDLVTAKNSYQNKFPQDRTKKVLKEIGIGDDLLSKMLYIFEY